MIVVLNKVDLLGADPVAAADKLDKVHTPSHLLFCLGSDSPSERVVGIWWCEQVKKKLRKVFESTKFGASVWCCVLICVMCDV